MQTKLYLMCNSWKKYYFKVPKSNFSNPVLYSVFRIAPSNVLTTWSFLYCKYILKYALHLFNDLIAYSFLYFTWNQTAHVFLTLLYDYKSIHLEQIYRLQQILTDFLWRIFCVRAFSDIYGVTEPLVFPSWFQVHGLPSILFLM